MGPKRVALGSCTNQVLLRHGADPTRGLFVRNNVDTMRALIAAGANVNARAMVRSVL